MGVEMSDSKDIIVWFVYKTRQESILWIIFYLLVFCFVFGVPKGRKWLNTSKIRRAATTGIEIAVAVPPCGISFQQTCRTLAHLSLSHVKLLQKTAI